MSTALTKPQSSLELLAEMKQDPHYQNLTAVERRQCALWVSLLSGVSKPGVTNQLQRIAREMGVSYPSARRKLSTWQKSRDWRKLADGRSLESVSSCRTADPGFREHWQKLVEGNQRSMAAARRQLIRQWKAKTPIPGYEDLLHWPAIPQGWSMTRLAALKPPKVNISLIRMGVKSAAKYMPQLLRTRVGLWPGSHIQMDDVWHDHIVRDGNQSVRVLEFGALDVWSACRFAWGTKPRRKKMHGGHEGLSEKDFRFFVAGVLWTYGYSANGTVLMLERGTAALRESVAQRLFDDTGGLITVEAGAMKGEQQALLGMWGGRAGGSGNFKSHLESLHNLIHNELAALPGQTGKDRQSQQESTYGLVRYQEKLLAWAQTMPPEIAQALKHPLMDYHTEFVPLLNYVYKVAINGRTEHRLEGWEEMGRVITQYTMAPGSELWLGVDDLPEETRPLVMSAAAADPARWTRRHRMSPAHAYETGRKQLMQASHAMLMDLLGDDCAVERRVEGSYIEFQDAEVSPSKLIYEARVTTPDGQSRELRRGEKYSCFANPFFPETLLIGDAKNRCVGTARQVRRISMADRETTTAQWGHNAMRAAEILEPVRARHAEEEADAIALRRHNAELGYGGSKNRKRDGGAKEAKKVATRKEIEATATVTAFLSAEAGDDWMNDGGASPYR
jgi:hypothetical protein